VDPGHRHAGGLEAQPHLPHCPSLPRRERDLQDGIERLPAEEGTSVSALLRDRLEELVRRHRAYDAARRRALARLRTAALVERLWRDRTGAISTQILQQLYVFVRVVRPFGSDAA
jgi:hypothetical protein